MRLVTDIFAFCSERVPVEHDFRERLSHPRSGSTTLQELAFTLRDGLEYVQHGVDAGLAVDDFVPRISFFFNSHSDFRGDRQMPRGAEALGRGHARSLWRSRSALWKLRLPHPDSGCVTDGPAALQQCGEDGAAGAGGRAGGTNSLHTNSLDEALALPTKETATIALRTQQIIAHESGVTNTVDPLGGSYFVEKLTREMEEGTLDYWRTIDRMGGMVEAIERGYPQREIAEASYQFQQAVGGRKSSSGSTTSSRKTTIRLRFSISTTRRPGASWRGLRS